MRKFLGLAAAGLLITGPATWAQSAENEGADAQPGDAESTASTDAASDAAAAAEAAMAADARAIQAHVNAYRTGNIDRFLDSFTPDAIVTVNGITAQGRAELRKLYALNFRPGAPKLEIMDSGISGPNVYLTTRYRLANGGELCCGYSEYTVRDGKIAQIAGSM